MNSTNIKMRDLVYKVELENTENKEAVIKNKHRLRAKIRC